MSEFGNASQQDIFLKLSHETAQIPWQELQPFFAAGKLIHIANSLDLVDIATQIVKDNKVIIEPLMMTGQITVVSDEQAKVWFSTQALVWAVVVKPWILVQENQSNG